MYVIYRKGYSIHNFCQMSGVVVYTNFKSKFDLRANNWLIIKIDLYCE